MIEKNKFSRREFVKRTAVAGAGIAMLSRFAVPSARAVANSKQLLKWMTPLRGLTALGDTAGIPCASKVAALSTPGVDVYNITAGQFTDLLHPQLSPTTLWGYWDSSVANPVKRHLGGLIIVDRGTAVRMRVTNKLPPVHTLPVDTTLPGANQAQNRIAVHLHGGFIPWICDGGPFDWWTPAGGVGLPPYATGLSFLNGPGGVFDTALPLINPATGLAIPLVPGQADYYYPNNQSTRLMWYHDHAHGTTRLNAYAGLATGYLVLDPTNDFYAGGNRLTGMPSSSKIPGLLSTIPLVFQDKIFVDPLTIGATDPTWTTKMTDPKSQQLGSLWYEHVYNPRLFRMFNGGKGTNVIAPPDPSCIPEFFGDTMLCNGTVYPMVTVEPKRYRFMMLNACNARFLNINLLKATAPMADIVTNPKTLLPNLATNPAGPPIIQIGTEAGFLSQEVVFPNNLFFNPATFTGNLLLAPAERADFIIDFSNIPDGTEYVMYNDAPGPFPAGPPTNDYWFGNPKNPVQPLASTAISAGTGPDTRQILRIKVQKSANFVPDTQPVGNILNPALMDPAPIVGLPAQTPGVQLSATAIIQPLPVPAFPIRQLTLNEDFDAYGRLLQRIGTTAPALVGKGFGLDYLAPATEVMLAGATEVWQIFNMTADTHPIHFHLINLQILSRQPFVQSGGKFTPNGAPRGPQPNELGWKETVQMHPGEVITMVAKFDLPAVPAALNVSSPRAEMAVTATSMGMGLPPVGTVLPTGKRVQAYHEYVYHCHILEHEEHDMMRPLVVQEVV